jgi:alkaline phosphatase D
MTSDLSPPVKSTTVTDIDDAQIEARDRRPETVFPQSVASGDPSSEGAILWTRISPDVYNDETPLFVELTEEKTFTDTVGLTAVDAGEITPAHDYTIKVDLDVSEVQLEAKHQYFYRFHYGGVASPAGRFRTLPERGSTPERIRFAVVTCQDYLYGNFSAYHHIADEDIDFILDLGDFIYEYEERRAGSREYPHRTLELPSGYGRASTLEDYRYLYRTYHSDRFLQRALENHTRIFTWDDHEFVNDIYWDETGTPRAPDHPLNDDPEQMRRLVRGALKAWWEYTPTRATFDPTAERLNEMLEIYRTFRFGDLLTLVVTDERLFKTKPGPNCAETRLPDRLMELTPDWIPFCYVSKDPTDTMLGESQREWFLDQVIESETTWTAWANEVLTLPARVGVGPFSFDPSDQAWDGYESEREEIMHRIKYGNVENFITLTGDMHTYLAGYQRLDYPSTVQNWITKADPYTEQSRRVGVELMTPAMTSINIAEKFREEFAKRLPRSYRNRFPNLSERLSDHVGQGIEGLFSAAVRRFMPHIKAFDSHSWGYSVVDVTRDDCIHRAYSVDKTVTGPDAEKHLINAVRIPRGRIEIQQLSDSSQYTERAPPE